jgi:hypothetical protein
MCQCECFQKTYVHPDQLKLEFPLDHENPFYKDGYETGLNWDANWMPGGPHIFRSNGRADDTLHIKSKQENEDYLNGFKRGLALRLKTNVHFREWWDANRSGLQRYTEPEEIHVCN